jgi:hypothetical protein
MMDGHTIVARNMKRKESEYNVGYSYCYILDFKLLYFV